MGSRQRGTSRGQGCRAASPLLGRRWSWRQKARRFQRRTVPPGTGAKTFRRTVVNDLALFQGHGTGAEAHGVIHLVQGHHNGEAILLVEVAQGLHDIAGRFRVQRGDGLVSQQHAGTLHQSTGDGGTLLLPAGKGTGALPSLFPDSHAGQGPKGKLPVIRVESTGQAAPQTSSVDLPEPEEPMRAIISPGATCRLM